MSGASGGVGIGTPTEEKKPDLSSPTPSSASGFHDRASRFRSPASFAGGTPRSSALTVKSRNSPASASSSSRRHQRDEGRGSTGSSTIAGDVMLGMPPSAALHDELTSLASSTARNLEEIWDEVGCSPEERASQLQALLEDMRQLCDFKVEEERGVAEQFRREIHEAREELKLSSQALRTEVDQRLLSTENSYGNGGQNLTDELATLDAALEGLRAASEAAKTDISACRDEIVSMHQSLGSDTPKQWLDVESDLTQPRRDQFHEEVSRLREAVHTRTSAIIQLLTDCQHVMMDLRVDPDESPLDRKIAGSLVRREKKGPFFLRSTDESEDCTGISASMLETLTTRLTELNGEKKRRKVRLNELGVEIANLWEKLRIPEEEQLAFTRSVQGLGTDTIEKGEKELQRLHVLKAKMIGRLIHDSRQEISKLWEETSTGTDQRDSFSAGKVTDESQFTDELLEEHDAYIQDLQTRLEKMRPVLKMVEKREEIIAERMRYEELQKDPDRLQQRGAALTKQLMMEEKMAKRIKKDLPKITDILERKLREWHVENGGKEHFLYNGDVYLEKMRQQEEEWQQYKNSEAQQKLKKKQEERATENMSSGHSFAPALPGKKKSISVTNKSSGGAAVVRPLANAQNRENRMRHPSRSRSRPRPRPTASR